ncbi:MAG: DUF2283 domain-containing protein [Candidatus Micrarchaeia archaeon]
MKPEYDESVDALYIKFSSKPAYFTVELSPRIAVDVNRDGRTVGVELLDASRVVSDLFQKTVSRGQVKRILCTVSEKDAVYLNFELEGARASLAVPLAYKSPVLEA